MQRAISLLEKWQNIDSGGKRRNDMQNENFASFFSEYNSCNFLYLSLHLVIFFALAYAPDQHPKLLKYDKMVDWEYSL